ncbi:fatty acid desaturase [Leptolyngbya sp. 'hensonii']|uniref:fatty acid desaturase n=1 Tax=Leptolyngbya sp. 'hensonii' TaxID=1922337 RepID=UPI00094F7CEE|nr:fatty acid desaturase [Leptolyngbya sp. 'hensonii']OLP18120.1 fatty acid desaturase [Leptolyngbya sp. 'hensonii']
MTSNLITRPLARESLPFTLHDVRLAIPAHCFQSSLWRSLAYFFLDIGVIAFLYWLTALIDQAWFFPLFWLMQGTLFWALFVVGHDCGHGSFSRYRWLNNLIGHLSHAPILVPYHGWRISHRTHHANTGNIDTDESWYPVTESQYNQMPWYEKLARFHLILVAYPLYLFRRSPGKQGSHFMPESPLFRPHEKWDVITSTICCALMLAVLAGVGLHYGLGFLLNYYVMPYVVFVVWLDLVTFLHHTDVEVPWYRGEDWYFLKGALSTVDRTYGFIDPIHHNIGTHVAHHIFITIPHYHLLEATAAIKPVLGEYYLESKEPIWKALWQGYRNCHFVSDRGSKIHYQGPQRSSRSS